MTRHRPKEYYEIRGKTEFTGYSFTISANKNLKRRDIRRLIGRFINSEMDGDTKCLFGSDAANGNAFYFILDRELTEKQANLLEDCIETYRKTHELGDEKYFFVPGINDAFRYTTAHRHLDIIEVSERKTAA